MNIFYNKQGIGNVLLITLNFQDRVDVQYEKNGDLVRIYDEKTKKTIRFNLFNASQYVTIEEEAGPSRSQKNWWND